jgi:hypothetical protein
LVVCQVALLQLQQLLLAIQCLVVAVDRVVELIVLAQVATEAMVVGLVVEVVEAVLALQ